MKILVIYLGRKGGGEIYSYSICKALQKRVDTSTVISRSAENIDNWRRDIRILHEVETYSNPREFLHRTLIKKPYRQITRIIEEEEPDIIYYPMISLWSPLINRSVNRTKIVSTIHDFKLHKGERGPLQYYVKRKSIEQSEGVVFLNRYSEEEFKTRRKRIMSTVIPLGHFGFYFSDSDENYVPVKGRSNLLFLGRILKYKGLEVLLKAYPIIKNAIPECRLIVAGTGNLGPYRKYLNKHEDIIVKNKWLSNEEIEDVVKDADVLVLPYIDSSQSGVITIGQIYGVPIIASKVGGIRDQIESGATGILVTPQDEEELADACIELLLDDNKRELLSIRERKYAKTNLGWDSIAMQLIDFFEKILSSTKPVA